MKVRTSGPDFRPDIAPDERGEGMDTPGSPADATSEVPPLVVGWAWVDEPGDPWRITEWHALPDVCLIAGCDGGEIDQRGPVWLRDGSMHKACTEHWEGIYRVLGEQVTWSSSDAMRWSPPVPPLVGAR